MAFQPPVQSTKPYQVSYRALANSGGTTLLVVGWVPKDGQPVPDPQEIAIAPGSSGSITGTVPANANARRMEIRVDLPNGTGSGTLDLSVDGSLVAEDNIAEDTLWTSLVS